MTSNLQLISLWNVFPQRFLEVVLKNDIVNYHPPPIKMQLNGTGHISLGTLWPGGRGGGYSLIWVI